MYNWYFEYLKQNEPEKVLSKTGVVLRRWINPVIRTVAPLTCKYKLEFVKKTKLPKGRPLIFAPTHGFKDDVLESPLILQLMTEQKDWQNCEIKCVLCGMKLWSSMNGMKRSAGFIRGTIRKS